MADNLGRPGEYNFEQSITEILGALEQIKRNMPNGEIKEIQNRLESMETSASELEEDLKELKEILMDPEDGIIVKLNKSIEINRKYEEYRDNTIQKKIDAVSQIENWKEGVNKALWILFALVVGIIVNSLLKK